MAVVIIWSDEATKTFDKNITYLLENWTEKEIRNFLKQTNAALSRVEQYPEMYTACSKKGCH